MSLSDRVMSYTQASPGKTDRDIAEALSVPVTVSRA